MCDVSHALTLLLIHSLSHCWALLHADTCKISSPTEWSTSSLGPFSSKCACFDTPDTNRTPNLSSLTNVPNTILTQALEHHECNCIVADTVRLRTSASAPIDPYTVPNWAAQRNVQNLAGSCPNPSKSLDEERARAGIVDASSSLGVVYPLKYGYHAARFRTRARVDAALPRLNTKMVHHQKLHIIAPGPGLAGLERDGEVFAAIHVRTRARDAVDDDTIYK
ncbi:hypothetical protein B0H14DRAFT_2622375 [Mycena olivaceomarginata]|nr:hypothetical protein B0H14DRAFT_2622375 [Mycena olivaceomarginata]